MAAAGAAESQDEGVAIGTIRVAGFQMEVTGDVRQNAAAIRRAIELAVAAGADILLTPEGSLSGYTPDFDAVEVSAALGEVAALARDKRVGLALGTCHKEADGLTYNQLRFYSPGGEYLGFHSKILRCGTLDDPPVGEINDYAASDLRAFSFGGILIGGLICNDLWANPICTTTPDPFLCQRLARMGARVILHAVNGGRGGSEWPHDVAWNFHESNLRLRAAAGNVWIVTVDNCRPTTHPCSAPSGVIRPDGHWVCRTENQGERFFVHTIELPES